MPITVRIAAFCMLAWSLGCQPVTAPAAGDPLGYGIEVRRATFVQRGTYPVPDTVGRLSLVVGDVEGSRLVERVALIDQKDGAEIVRPADIEVGDSREFRVDGTRYRFELVETDSAHVLNDTATFEFSMVR